MRLSSARQQRQRIRTRRLTIAFPNADTPAIHRGVAAVSNPRRPVSIVVVRWALVGLLLIAAACDTRAPASPSPWPPRLQTQPPPSSLPPPPLPAPGTLPASAPPLSGASTTYVYSADLDRPASGVTRASRFVLYDSGAFSFRYDTLPGGPYAGSYQQEEGRIVFDFGPITLALRVDSRKPRPRSWARS
jgi:hypothetical protein